MATRKLKKSRKSEQQKVDLAVKYAEQRKATGGGRTRLTKIRRQTIDAGYIPMAQTVPRSRRAPKQKTGRRHSPPR